MSNKNKLPDVFNVEQIEKLFDAIDRPKVGVAVALAFFCGLRISEVCNLRIEDIDLDNKRLKVVDGKNSRRKFSRYGKDRYVPIPPLLISPLKKWIDILNGGVWLFPSDKSPDTHLLKKSLHEQFRIVLQRAGLLIPQYEVEYTARINGKKTPRKVTRHKYYFHTLRHAYATYLRDKNVDIYTISDLLGHNQVTTTQIYARISDTQRQRAVCEAFNEGLRPQVMPPQHYPQAIPPPAAVTTEDRLLEVKKLELEVRKMELSQNKVL